MKRLIVGFSLMFTLLSACTGLPATSQPVSAPTDLPRVLPATEPVPTSTEVPPTEPASPKLPAASFESRTYLNEADGFALEYPAGWTVQEMVVGSRGTQVQFLSSPELLDAATLPEGATRVSATLYDWEPRNDLAAYVENMKAAWEASGFTVLSEEERILELGLPAVEFTLQTPEVQTVFLIASLGERYLVLSGEGDLELVKEIIGRVRPILQ
ncbi:MAG TPA: hypothetical protein VK900_09850 [Anaerolineales bacterium]|nr:hypothetical protein [Anaerolineales bacterium]